MTFTDVAFMSQHDHSLHWAVCSGCLASCCTSS